MRIQFPANFASKSGGQFATESHGQLLRNIQGIGKSVFCRYFCKQVDVGSLAVAYDCFGAGSYRSRSSPRHRHRDALIQIVNELAVIGLCDPVLVGDTSLDSDIMRTFLSRITVALDNLRKSNKSAKLFILIDAADNAEMAAEEFRQSCFAAELLQENFPLGCQLILLCRSERIGLLKPNSKIVQLELASFSEAETLQFLRSVFPDSTDKDGAEFHRLTSANPRVQANALSAGHKSVTELLKHFGPLGMTVEEQIGVQLQTAVSKIKDFLPENYQVDTQAICIGLASLPPHVPIDILAKVAGVSTAAIRSFVSEIGRSLWLSDYSVQFRDEPTETWFKDTFLVGEDVYKTFIDTLEPLADEYVYVAEVLPHLYLKAAQYEKLIRIALSDDYLPKNNPIDARNVRLYRLQFAFQAALRSGQYKDAINIAIRGGEEVAGNQRQLDLFKNNIDLLVALQDKQKVQDIAFRRKLKGNWTGSENLYTASLLSGVEDYKGEARGYLRAAENWFNIFIEEGKKNKRRYHQNEIEEMDMSEMTFVYFNIYGTKGCLDFLDRFKYKEYAFGRMKNLASRLIDLGRFEEIDKILEGAAGKPYYILAVVDELHKVGKLPKTSVIKSTLGLLSRKKLVVKPPDVLRYDGITTSIVSFVETCVHGGLNEQKIIKALNNYIPELMSVMVYSSNQNYERHNFLRALALRMLLNGSAEVDVLELLPEDSKSERKLAKDDLKEAKEIVGGLLPWYLLRARLLAGQIGDLLEECVIATKVSQESLASRHRSYDTLPAEITSLKVSLMVFYAQASCSDLTYFYEKYIKGGNSLDLYAHIDFVRTASRAKHLLGFKQAIEESAYGRIQSLERTSPDEVANHYIDMSRAVLNTAKDDASVYFDEAVRVVSKFGDEIIKRWEAVVALAKHVCTGGLGNDQLAYRFIRCAEIVGDYVSKEKYWDRDETVAICTRISQPVGIAALSRWRDRDVGRFNLQLNAMLVELLESKKIYPSVAWSLTKMLSDHNITFMLSICLEHESDKVIRAQIFEDAIELLQKDGTLEQCSKEIEMLANKYEISTSGLDEILTYYNSKDDRDYRVKEGGYSQRQNEAVEKIDWHAVFGSLNLVDADQFRIALRRWEMVVEHRYVDYKYFWEELIARVSESQMGLLTDAVLQSDVNRYEIYVFFAALPDTWKNKISYKKDWDNRVKQLGRKYAVALCNPYSYDAFIEQFKFSKKETNILNDGVFEGLEDGAQFSDSNTYFGFAGLAVPKVSASEAESILDYALSRFELHIESDFGDGEWKESLQTSDDINVNIAGFVWSALGSPRSVERWNAVHVLRQLASFGHKEILLELINWMEKGKVEAFGSSKFPFYDRHAKQYLLIALAKISKEHPKLLIAHKSIFLRYGISEQHVIIRRFALEIVSNLGNAIDGVYNGDDLKLVNSLKLSKKATRKVAYQEVVDSYWHTDVRKDKKVHNFHFGWDFNRYWFEPLGRVFGISSEQVADIAGELLVEEWGFEKDNAYDKDPRVGILERYDREISHSHGSYPKTDNLNFYLSYHAMMVVAGRLYENMPLVSKRGSYYEGWDYWLSRHLLTDNNGNWLADFKDPVPYRRPAWVYTSREPNWKTEISEDYMDNLLKIKRDGENWLRIWGGWQEIGSGKHESVSVRSGLVSKGNSNALLRALQTCSDPYDYKIPDYQERDMEIDDNSFVLKGWIVDEQISTKLDEHDPYADNVDYPPFQIGKDIVKKMKLVTRDDGRKWHSRSSQSISLQMQMWSSFRQDIDKYPDQDGKCLKASVLFLKSLCLTFDCELLIDLQVRRKIDRSYENDKYESEKVKVKLYILTSDGELRSADENGRIR